MNTAALLRRFKKKINIIGQRGSGNRGLEGWSALLCIACRSGEACMHATVPTGSGSGSQETMDGAATHACISVRPDRAQHHEESIRRASSKN
jgi:hypothetical protein